MKKTTHDAPFQWAVIGAGPAGIAAVGQLIDHGIAPEKIAWVDPDFTVGAFGTDWKNVPSNTKVKLFTAFLTACNAFEYAQCDHDFALTTLPAMDTCQLNAMAEPLQWVTKRLQKKVTCFTDFAESLALANRHWHIHLGEHIIQAKNTVLATGSEPKTLAYANPETIPMPIAMNPEQLAVHCQPTDTVAVFGSSHSAILAIRFLLEAGVKKVINFYRSPLRYAVPMDNWTLYDDTGLKGSAAQWAREHIDGTQPPGLARHLSTEAHIEQYLPLCNKAVYAVGFQRRHIPMRDFGVLDYDPRTGIIAPGLFGFGIGFPEEKENPFGFKESRVGLWKFMEYIREVMPVWLNYST